MKKMSALIVSILIGFVILILFYFIFPYVAGGNGNIWASMGYVIPGVIVFIVFPSYWWLTRNKSEVNDIKYFSQGFHYECEICHKRFKTKSEANKHDKIFHNN